MSPKKQQKSKSKESKSVMPLKPINSTASKRNTNKPTTNINDPQNIKEPLDIKIRNWLIVAFTGALAFFTIQLYETAVQQTETANKSAEAALISAMAAKNSIELSEKSFRVGNRAYVIIKSWNVIYPYGDSTKISWIEFENVGNTPAKNLEILFALGCDTVLTIDNINEKIDIINYETSFVSKRDLGPNAPTKQNFPLTQNDPKMHAEIKSEKFKMYAFANITYFDIFGEKHFTHFSCVWNTITEMAEILPIYNDSN